MILVLASALRAEAKLTLSTNDNVYCYYFAEGDTPTGFTIEPNSIPEMKVDESRDITIKSEPIDTELPNITFSIDENNKNYVDVVNNDNKRFTITAKAPSNRPVEITFKADGLANQTLTIEKITRKEEQKPTTGITHATDFKLNKKPEFNKLQIGGTGVDFQIIPVPETGILGHVNFEIKPKNACTVTPTNNNGSYHITAKTPCNNISITIKVDGLEGKEKTIRINSIVADTNKGQSASTDLNKEIQKLQQQINYLKTDSIQCRDTITELQKKISSLQQKNKRLDSQIRDLENEKPKISIPLAIIIGIVGTLIIAVILFIILYKKIERTFSEDLKDVENNNEHLQHELSEIKSNRNTNNSRIKELEGERDKLKQENDSLKMEIMHLQKNTSKVQSKTNPEIVEDQSMVDNKPAAPEPLRIASLYSDCIIDGYFNKVSEKPDEDTVFELVLNNGTTTTASIIIYPNAYRRIIANPAFINGCEKQIVGNSSVNVERKGIAEKDANNGKWRLINAPIIEIR